MPMLHTYLQRWPGNRSAEPWTHTTKELVNTQVKFETKLWKLPAATSAIPLAKLALSTTTSPIHYFKMGAERPLSSKRDPYGLFPFGGRVNVFTPGCSDRREAEWKPSICPSVNGSVAVLLMVVLPLT